jgi:hypothetical protein
LGEQTNSSTRFDDDDLESVKDQFQNLSTNDVYTVENTLMPPLVDLTKQLASAKGKASKAPTPKEEELFKYKKELLKKQLNRTHQKLTKMKTNDTPVIQRTASNSTMSDVSDGKKKRGSRGAKAQAQAQVQMPKVELPVADLNPVNQLILTLLSLNGNDRDEYLKKTAKERGILINQTTGTNKQLIVNPNYTKAQHELRQKSIRHLYGPGAIVKKNSMPVIKDNPHIRPFIQAPTNISTMQSSKKTKSFEDEVTRLLHGGVKDLDPKAIKSELKLTNPSKAEKNAFTLAENINELEAFVERLVKNKVGYIIEGEIRINAKNNYQAFVSDTTSDIDCCITSILKRKCAMEGDLVQVFVEYGVKEVQESDKVNSEAGEKKRKLFEQRSFVNF